MSQFRAIGMDSDLVKRLRASRLDPFGSEAETWVANDGRFPCRHCLDEARHGSEVLLISYQPLQQDTPFAARGPVFICAEACEGFQRSQEVPETVRTREVNLRAYTPAGRMIYRHSRLTQGAEAQHHIAAMLDDNEISEVHAHTALHGCFLCNFVRA
jgi:hypothetical protein